MNIERLDQIEEIYHAALEIPISRREAFFDEMCGADADLRREVESLLAFNQNSPNFLDASLESLAAGIFAVPHEFPNLIGKEIAHYKIVKLLGRGGMGEVFLAEDIKLNRPVALKCLPPEFVEDKDRMSRFIREAKTASALNHPNIITIHEINEAEGMHFIATEYIDGKTLHEHTKGEPLSAAAALEIAVQIASALDEAHAAGIIHRDIKPDNVMIRANGLVKILDFGIAKLIEKGRKGEREKRSWGEEELTSGISPLLPFSPSHLLSTSPGFIIGTANYMSPEQAKGAEIDARTDIFSFGIVLYEMLSGKLPFDGDSAIDTLGAILHKEPPPIRDLLPGLPREVEVILKKSLSKNTAERYQNTRDLLTDLQRVKQRLDYKEAGRAFPPEKSKPEIGETANQTAPARDDESERQTDFVNEPQITDESVFGTKNYPTKASAKKGTADISPAGTDGKDVSAPPDLLLPIPRKAVYLTLLLICLLTAGGYFGYRYSTSKNRIASIAVMPFVNDSGNSEIEYISDGMTENLITRLSTIPQLSIKARSTVFTYKGKTPTAQKIGEELNVDAVLFGRLVRRGDELKIDLELVDTTTQDVLWSENYDLKLNRLGSLDSEIARRVSDNLRLKLTNAEQTQIAKTYTANPKAQHFYLKGRFHWNRRNKADFEKSIEYFKQAIGEDPNFALAYTGLADAYALMPLYGNFRPNEYKPLAKQSALKALEIDANLAEAHASLGYIINTYDFDWESAEREYKTAIRLNPNYATAHQWFAEHLAFRGKTDEAFEEISKALELDPFSLVINRMKGNILGFAGKHDEAIIQLQKTIELYPENPLVRFNLGEIFAAKGMHKEAVGQYLIALKMDGERPSDIQKLDAAYKNDGWKGFWMKYLESLENQRKTLLASDQTAYFSSENTAYAYAAAQNKDKSIEFLNQAYKERDPNLVTIKTSEVYDFLVEDPRFKTLIRNIGLPE